MTHYLTEAAHEAARTLGLRANDVCQMARFSAHYSGPCGFNRRFEGFMLVVTGSGVVTDVAVLAPDDAPEGPACYPDAEACSACCGTMVVPVDEDGRRVTRPCPRMRDRTRDLCDRYSRN